MAEIEYKLLVTILFIAIGVSIIFHIFTQSADAAFSEVYFENALPNLVNINQTYDFNVTIGNHEGKPMTYSYEPKIELFNLYDVTEGSYRCASKYRKKVEMAWLSNNSLYYTKSDDYGIIDWPYYSIRYTYQNALESGFFKMVFHDENELYSFTIYEDEIEFLKNISIRKKIKLKNSNTIVINSSNGMQYYLNGELIFNESISIPTNGKFDFQSTGLPIISNLVVYKDSPIEVTNQKYIREYEIDNTAIAKKMEEMRQDLNLVRRQINLTDSNASNYFDNPGDNFTMHYTPTDELSILSSLATENRFESQSYAQNSSAEELSWSNYTLNLDFQTYLENPTLLFKVDELMILFHKTDVFVIEDFAIQRRRSPVLVGANQLRFAALDDNIIFSVNSLPLLSIKKPLGFKNISIYTKNTILALGNIVLTKKDCGTEACRRVYRIDSERPLSQKRNLEATADEVEISSGLAQMPILGIAEIFKGYNNSGLFSDYDIEIDPSLINENIPSEEYVFDGQNAVVSNQDNYSFSFSFNNLEGLGLLETSFYNNDGIKTATMIVSQQDNKTYLFTNLNGISQKTADIKMDTGNRHRVDIVHELKNTNFYFDGIKTMDIKNIDLSDGYFGIATYNTHFAFTDIVMFNRNTSERIPFSIDKDPCRLRKIDETALDKKYLYLDSGEKSLLTSNFTIKNNFDYGMVSVTLGDKEIHFWVINND